MRVHFKGERGIESTFSEGLLIKGGSETFKICFFWGGWGRGQVGSVKRGEVKILGWGLEETMLIILEIQGVKTA